MGQAAERREPETTGFEEALARAYEQHREGLVETLYRLTTNWEDAEDAVHHAFAVLCESRGALDLSRPLRNLLLTVALNHARKNFRDHGRKVRAEEAPEHPIHAPAGRSDRVAALVSSLPRDERAIVVLYYYESFPYAQIAEALDMPLGTVKWKMHNAFQRMRVHLEALADELQGR